MTGPVVTPPEPTAGSATAPVANTGNTPVAPAPVAGGFSVWLWTTIAALLGWIGTTCWLLMRQRPARAESRDPERDARESALFKSLLQACNQGDATAARSAVQRWAQAFFEEKAPPTLATVGARFGDDALSRALEELDRRLYAENPAVWDGNPLALALKACRKQGRPDRRAASALPPLYQGS